MSFIDLHSTLEDWPYDSDKISVRKILGADGIVRVQMRVELGIVQMDAEGRPDGMNPHRCTSYLEYHGKRLARHRTLNGTPLGFALTPEECGTLRQEASLFYRRYVAFFVLEEFENVVRDTKHSLAIFDICSDYALETDDQGALEEFRPYVIMMNARGLAYQALQESEPASALAHVNRGIMEIKSHHTDRGVSDSSASSEEIKILRILGRELGSKIPRDSVLVTRKALRAAIEQEQFEEAARLRDELKNLYSHNN